MDNDLPSQAASNKADGCHLSPWSGTLRAVHYTRQRPRVGNGACLCLRESAATYSDVNRSARCRDEQFRSGTLEVKIGLLNIVVAFIVPLWVVINLHVNQQWNHR